MKAKNNRKIIIYVCRLLLIKINLKRNSFVFTFLFSHFVTVEFAQFFK